VRGELQRSLISENHQFPSPGPLLLVPLLRHELVVDVAAHADPVRAGEAGGANQQLGRVLRGEGLSVVGAAVILKAATPELVHSWSGPGGGVFAANLSLNSNKFATPRNWGAGVGAIGGPFRMKVAIGNASRARWTGLHLIGSGRGSGGTSLLEHLSNHPAGLLPGSFGGRRRGGINRILFAVWTYRLRVKGDVVQIIHNNITNQSISVRKVEKL
jgi:hypothetical protein